MKRIFLTSGLVLCLACPAFATGESWSGNTSGEQTAGCTEPNLGVYFGDTTMYAQWTVNYGTVTLNDNAGTEAGQGGDTASAYELYLTPYDANGNSGTGMYTRSGNTEATYVFTKLAIGDDALTTLPTGKQITYNITQTLPNGSEPTNTIGVNPDDREFRGYFASTATNDTADSAAFINSTGKMTEAGVAAANNGGYDNDTAWKALYTAASPQLTGTPSSYGYTFNGWSIDGSETLVDTSTVNSYNNYVTKTAVASWTAKSWTITYNCGDGNGTIANGTATYDSDSDVWASNDDTTNGSGCKLNGKHFTGWTCTVAAADTDNTTAQTIITNGGVSCPANATAPGSCTGSSINNIDHLNDNATISCVAVYANNTIGTITWNDNGATTAHSGTPTTSCEYGTSVTLPTAPERVGYSFAGWKVSQN